MTCLRLALEGVNLPADLRYHRLAQGLSRLCGETAPWESQNDKFLLRWLQLGQIWTPSEASFYEANWAGMAKQPAMKLNGRRNGLFFGFSFWSPYL